MKTALIAVHIFGFLLLFSLKQQEVRSKKSCFLDTDGCSIPFNLSFVYKKTFTPACNRHGVCYCCRVRWGWPRSACDGRFKQDMYKLCEHVMGLWKRFSIAAVSSGDIVEECKSGADIYFAGVTVAGWLRYYTTSPRWCDAECAKEYGNPFTRKKDF